MAEVPLKVRAEREHGRSRMASNIVRYGLHSAMIMLRTVRDIKPLKFFGGLGGILFTLSGALGTGMLVWYLRTGGTSPYTSLITIIGVLLVLSFILLVIGLLADMMGRHRQVSEELLYLARRRVYARHAGRLPLRSGRRQAEGASAPDPDDARGQTPHELKPTLEPEILVRTEREKVS
jgi:hypothetical protein